MLFNSIVFIFLFLPVAYLVFWALRTTGQRHVWLTITGYVFYGYWDPRFCLLMAFSTLVSYLAGLAFLRWHAPHQRKLILIVPITIDLLLLGFFKYAGFAARTVNSTLEAVNLEPIAPVLDIILPIGISFYTFHTISYIVDAYRGVITPTRSLFEFSAYVSLFSQLVAGPIVRFRQIEKDLENLATANRVAGLYAGLSFFVFGLAEKVLVADSLAVHVDSWLLDYAQLSTTATWLAMLGYTMQLYFDFSGYSSMAVGLGLMFGLNIPQNFNSPYRARDPSDFWRRWHISLSTCIRDYIFIPLGGSRGSALFTARNLMIAMFLGGLWHGANTTFVVWGIYHGALLVAYRFSSGFWDKVPSAIAVPTMFLLAVIGWVFFRAADMTMALAVLDKMFTLTGGQLPIEWQTLAVLVIAATAWAIFGPNVFEFHARRPAIRVPGPVLGLFFGVALAIIAGSRESPFLYFQF
jgi:alginate O-acetyltransferase complex protein AlgI